MFISISFSVAVWISHLTHGPYRDIFSRKSSFGLPPCLNLWLKKGFPLLTWTQIPSAKLTFQSVDSHFNRLAVSRAPNELVINWRRGMVTIGCLVLMCDRLSQRLIMCWWPESTPGHIRYSDRQNNWPAELSKLSSQRHLQLMVTHMWSS